MLKQFKWILPLLLLLFGAVPQTAAAEEAQSGTVTVQLEASLSPDASFSGVGMELIQVGTISDGSLQTIAPFSDDRIDLNSISTPEQLSEASKTLAQTAQNQNVIGTRCVSDENGKCLFTGLAGGVYLLLAYDLKTYDEISPALLELPVWSSETQSEQWTVTVYPKHASKQQNPSAGQPLTPPANPVRPAPAAPTISSGSKYPSRLFPVLTSAQSNLIGYALIGCAALVLFVAAVLAKRRFAKK